MKIAKRKILSSIITIVFLILAISLVAGTRNRWQNWDQTAAVPTVPPTTEPTQPPTTVVTEPPRDWVRGYLAGFNLETEYFSEEGVSLGMLPRGTKLKYEVEADGRIAVNLDGQIVYLAEGADIVDRASDVIPIQTMYVRTTVNLRDEAGRLLAPLAEKGAEVLVMGYDRLEKNGEAHMYRVKCGEDEGYIMPWYLADNQEDALANYDGGSYAIHQARENQYGGGGAANLDYFPREKGPIEGNEMPAECRTLYLASWCLGDVEAYLEIADSSGINAFVVDITDGSTVGYGADVMQQYCPSGAAAAQNTVEAYRAAIKKLKDAGYYVIGRITTFNDSWFVHEHPEFAIIDTAGNPLKLAGTYWPTPYSRDAWQYKVDLAVEAVELMGFNEIQFDYVRFPDNTYRHEKNGTVDFRNTYGETKAQAIQRFLMYAADILHEHGAYVSADVYGESAFTYVTAYGQYWAAISNVVDVISGMPYPDHFGAVGSWRPWEHPYDILYSWGQNVSLRQGETATPAVVRTWIQAYNAIKEPYNTYGPDEVAAQIRALRDTGCVGGYMTWNSGSSIDKYRWLIPAFAPPEGE